MFDVLKEERWNCMRCQYIATPYSHRTWCKGALVNDIMATRFLRITWLILALTKSFEKGHPSSTEEY